MLRRVPFAVLLLVAALLVGCSNKKVNNPLANVGSKQPDKVLFDRAMDAMKHNRFDVARMTMQTLINTYPDSEYIARAKLAVADSWYAEGGSTSLAQAEVEYKAGSRLHPRPAGGGGISPTHPAMARQQTGAGGERALDGGAGSDRRTRVPGGALLL